MRANSAREAEKSAQQNKTVEDRLMNTVNKQPNQQPLVKMPELENKQLVF